MTDETAKAIFSANVKRLLHERGRSINWLVTTLDEFPGRIYPAVNGVTIPGIGLSSRIADALQVSLDVLCNGPNNFADNQTTKPRRRISRNLEKSA